MTGVGVMIGDKIRVRVGDRLKVVAGLGLVSQGLIRRQSIVFYHWDKGLSQGLIRSQSSVVWI